MVVLAFSGGGTRAAAFSYGVLEFLRKTEIRGPKGNTVRLLDEVDVITGVSGGSFTALAYGLYGDKLFAEYEQRFLKRDVQGEIVSRTLSPANWARLASTGWGRSELAAQLYDEILFNGATFGDLDRGSGPLILASATDISTGSRFVYNQRIFDIICSDLNAVPLSRAAASSSAVPVVLSPVTINNYGGTCSRTTPPWVARFTETDNPPRPAARAIRSLKAEEAFGDGVHRPFLHLVDGGVADNVGMRSVLDSLEVLEALHEAGVPTVLDSVRRIIVFVVNSLSSPPTKWDESESPPGTVDILLKSAGTPIDAFSYEAVELLKDTAAKWQSTRLIRNSAAMATNKDPAVTAALRIPDVEIYAIDVSFAALKDDAERAYLNQQPTTFVLTPEAVDRLRAAAGTIIMDSPEFKRLLKDVGAKIVMPGPSRRFRCRPLPARVRQTRRRSRADEERPCRLAATALARLLPPLLDLALDRLGDVLAQDLPDVLVDRGDQVGARAVDHRLQALRELLAQASVGEDVDPLQHLHADVLGHQVPARRVERRVERKVLDRRDDVLAAPDERRVAGDIGLGDHRFDDLGRRGIDFVVPEGVAVLRLSGRAFARVRAWRRQRIGAGLGDRRGAAARHRPDRRLALHVLRHLDVVGHEPRHRRLGRRRLLDRRRRLDDGLLDGRDRSRSRAVRRHRATCRHRNVDDDCRGRSGPRFVGSSVGHDVGEQRKILVGRKGGHPVAAHQRLGLLQQFARGGHDQRSARLCERSS